MRRSGLIATRLIWLSLAAIILLLWHHRLVCGEWFQIADVMHHETAEVTIIAAVCGLILGFILGSEK